MIAVMGATGNVGSKVANLLLQAGEDVRALQHGRDLTALREAGAEVLKGDAMIAGELMAFSTALSQRSCCCRRTSPILRSLRTVS